MNQKLFRARMETKKYLDPQFNIKEGVIKINAGNTLEHELAKFLLAWEIAQNNQSFITEAIFHNGKRADVLVLDTGEAYEVLHSETAKQAERKIADYPVPIKTFRSLEIIRPWIKQLDKKHKLLE